MPRKHPLHEEWLTAEARRLAKAAPRIPGKPLSLQEYMSTPAAVKPRRSRTPVNDALTRPVIRPSLFARIRRFFA